MISQHLSRPGFWLVPALVLFGMAGQALADPPGRVARLSYVSGDVSMQPAGLDEWSEARINRPLITGDRIYSDRASRVELEIGAATVRLDERTSFSLLNLDDDAAQIELTAGTINLTVRHVFEGQTYEVDTPTLALVIYNSGVYRIDVAPDGDSTMVSVIDGDADVYGQNNSSFRVREGESYRFYDTRLTDYEIFDLPRRDNFDRWCFERAERYERSPSRRYVSEDVIGYADLDDYGTWNTVATYGSIWYPSHVQSDWTPYRNGHWAWIDPWGWTWVDDAPWGFAPSHYGRWAYVGSRWGWVPGPRHVRPIYAPALVAFVGGGGFSVSISSGGPVGWFPLGPRDVYVPWYEGSRSYFNNINSRNTTVINNVYITNVYNDYSRGRPVSNFDYAYRNNRNAYTAVPHDAFINARSVERSRVQVTQAQLSQGRVVSRVEVAPTARSFVGGSATRGSGRAVSANTFERPVIARTAPPTIRLDAKERIRAISRNNNQPLAITEMRQLSAKAPRSDERKPRRIEVVAGQRPSATATPSRPTNGNDRTNRAPRATPPSRIERDGGRTPVAPRNERGVAARPVETERKPREEPIGRTPPTMRERPPVPQSGRSEPATSPRPSVQREAPVRGIESGTPRNRVDVPSRAPVERAQPEQREIRQREPVQRSEPVQRAPMPMQERRAAPQPRVEPQQRAAPQPQQREMPPRSAPQRQERPAVQQRPVVQPRPAQQQVQPPQRKSRADKEADEDKDKDKQERKRRE
jgi:hypothetical protein